MRNDIQVQAQTIRAMTEAAAQYLPDDKAGDKAILFPAWAPGVSYALDDRRCYGDKLYKCRQAHTSQAGWEPDKTPAMWAVIDVTHTGTLEDPIPAAENMEYTQGLYYLDPQDGKTYLCARSTGQPVAYLPHALVGTYFEEVA